MEQQEYLFITFSLNGYNGESLNDKINDILKQFNSYNYFDLKAVGLSYSDNYGGGSIQSGIEYILILKLKNLTN